MVRYSVASARSNQFAAVTTGRSRAMSSCLVRRPRDDLAIADDLPLCASGEAEPPATEFRCRFVGWWQGLPEGPLDPRRWAEGARARSVMNDQS
jgi:hypothetical protein